MLRYHFVSQVMSRDFCLGLAACSLEMKDTVRASPQDKYHPPNTPTPKCRGSGAKRSKEISQLPLFLSYPSNLVFLDYLPKG